jgi:hypothetical protein
MCLILAIVGVVFRSLTPRRSVYGDQGEEVAWQVGAKRFIGKRGQEEKQDNEIARQVRFGIGGVEFAQRFLGSFRDFEARWALQREARYQQHVYS